MFEDGRNIIIVYMLMGQHMLVSIMYPLRMWLEIVFGRIATFNFLISNISNVDAYYFSFSVIMKNCRLYVDDVCLSGAILWSIFAVSDRDLIFIMEMANNKQYWIFSLPVIRLRWSIIKRNLHSYC